MENLFYKAARKAVWVLAGVMLLCVGKASLGQDTAAVSPAALVSETERGPAALVNTIIGCTCEGSHSGKCFPGADTPFGMVQLSPDTVTGGDNGPGYSYQDKTIEGFSFNNLPVGWFGDWGNVQVMPETGPLVIGRAASHSPFSHADEITRAGYYSVMLQRYQTRVELTAAVHTGMMRITFPAAGPHRIKIDLHRRVGGHAVREHVRIVNAQTLAGWVYCSPSGGGFGHGNGGNRYTVHFYMQFSRPLVHFGVWSSGQTRQGVKEATGPDLVAFARFAASPRVVLVKCGLSYVSTANARLNLRHEIRGWSFDKVYAAAVKKWNHALGAVTITGGTAREQTIFYTALYHAMLYPQTYTDVNGEYPDHAGKTHKAVGFTDRTIFSGWDVFRSEFPLMNLIDPQMVNDEVISLMKVHQYGGCNGLPIWELNGWDSGCMVGSPAVSVIAGAYLSGIRNYDVAEAWRLCRNVLLGPANKSNLQGFADWQNLGYNPGQLSQSLQTAYFDYCAARLALALNHEHSAEKLLAQAQNYRKLYDAKLGNMWPRAANGKWLPPGPRTGWGPGTIESTPYQETWFVPQDPYGLISLMGGRKAFLANLQHFFKKTPGSFTWNPYENQSNEPVAFVPFLFTFAGKPWLTQYWTHFVDQHAYKRGPKGLPGNDDCGQTSAWYVLTAMGFHPETPCSNVLILTSPEFAKSVIRLAPMNAKGRNFTMVAKNSGPKNIYIQSATFNGKTLNRAWLWDQDVLDGGTLVLNMGPKPNKNWGGDSNDLPPSPMTAGSGIMR